MKTRTTASKTTKCQLTQQKESQSTKKQNSTSFAHQLASLKAREPDAIFPLEKISTTIISQFLRNNSHDKI